MNSFRFLVYICTFLPAVMLAYHLTSEKRRWIVLLAASYIFYIINSRALTVFILLTTVLIYFCGLWLEKIRGAREEAKAAEEDRAARKAVALSYDKKMKRVTALCLVICFGVIAVLKYSAFFNSSVNSLLSKLGVSASLSVRHYVLPLGISFYTMMAASYIIDVRRGTISADRNFFRLALYLSFFPQILEGPMCRYSETADQLMAGKRIEYRNLTRGLQRIGAGVARRMLVADRVNNYVAWVFSYFPSCDGGQIIIATLCYSFQIYMDFSGTMDIVIGTAEIFGIEMPENFRRPFFSQTASEFWTRWHISLGRWFSDYIFYPVSMSAPMKKLTKSARKKLGSYYGPLLTGAVALLAVWLCNGLWHGSGWQYIFFGVYYFVIILLGQLTAPLREAAAKRIHLAGTRLEKGLRIFRTFLIFNLGEMFFRARDLRSGFEMLGKMIRNPSLVSLFNGTIFKMWLDPKDMLVLAVVLAALIFAGVRAEKGRDLRDDIGTLPPAARIAIWALFTVAILVFGGYGYGYTYVEPIYASF